MLKAKNIVFPKLASRTQLPLHENCDETSISMDRLLRHCDLRADGGCGCTCRCSGSPAWSRAPRVAVIRCCKIRPNSQCGGSDDYAGYMLARHIKPKKIVFHNRLLPHETCRMNRVRHLKTKKTFLVFSDSGFMTYQPQT